MTSLKKKSKWGYIKHSRNPQEGKEKKQKNEKQREQTESK